MKFPASSFGTAAFFAHLSLLLFAFLKVFIAQHGVSAQTTTAVCQSNFSWMENSRGQSPCLVASYILGVCNSGQANVGSLSQGRHYIGPRVENANQCRCSSVFYNLMSACGTCQIRTIIAWSSWMYNCTADITSIGEFPLGIPPGTSVPGWAYMDPRQSSDMFDPVAARNLINQPESTASPRSSSTNSGTGPSPTDTETPSSSSTRPIGAIVGGVVGGILGVLLITVLGIWIVRRRKQKNAPPQLPPSNPRMDSVYAPNVSGYNPSNPYMYGPGAPYQQPPGPAGGSQSQRLYDPNDPSTFPTTPVSQHSPSIYTSNNHQPPLRPNTIAQY